MVEVPVDVPCSARAENTAAATSGSAPTTEPVTSGSVPAIAPATRVAQFGSSSPCILLSSTGFGLGSVSVRRNAGFQPAIGDEVEAGGGELLGVLCIVEYPESGS